MKMLFAILLLCFSCSNGTDADTVTTNVPTESQVQVTQNTPVEKPSGETWLQLEFEGYSFKSANEVMASPDVGKSIIRIQGENSDYIIVLNLEAKRGLGGRFGKGYVMQKKDGTKIYDTESERRATVLTLTIEKLDDFQTGGFMEGSFTFTREEADGNASGTENGRFKARLGKIQ
jgi:hypothetical protein